VTYSCPSCGKQYDASALDHPGGLGGGLYCPHCQQRVYLAMPYGRTVAVLSLLLSVGVMALLQIKNITAFVVGSVCSGYRFR
jgi:DNA-directed RNA polymerase subunit RPC12/RpoP